jgi:hypothetical protein
MSKAITAPQAMSHPIVVETINVLAEMSQRLQDENDELKAALAAEREACAKVCDDEWGTGAEKDAGIVFAKAIRARGET